MAINIGKKIKHRAKELRIGPTELSGLVHTSKQNIHGIYKRKSLDTELLRKLSVALNYDFFEYYRINLTTGKLIKAEKNANNELEKLKQELENLKEKYELLKKLNKFLEKKK